MSHSERLRHVCHGAARALAITIHECLRHGRCVGCVPEVAMRRVIRGLAGLLIVVSMTAALGALPGRASAQEGEVRTPGERYLGGLLAFGLIGVPSVITFGIADIRYLGRRRPLPTGWAVTQLVFGA